MFEKKEADIPLGFNSPTALPANAEEAQSWQRANRTWWEGHPMRYDWQEELGLAEFSREFYDEIDRRFFALAQDFLPKRVLPFDALIPFDALKNYDVLEIGVGNGSHAGLLAARARSFTGIDITQYAVTSTLQRFRIFDLPGRILQMDAEKMDFPDESFDFIWSWGVIHHSSDTRAVLKEMYRVLRPGGFAVVMVYHRAFFDYYVRRGILRGLWTGLGRQHSMHGVVQFSSDGALARFYRVSEWKALAGEFFQVSHIRVMGSKSDVIPFPGRMNAVAAALLPSAVGRFLTNTLGFGHFLVSELRKPATLA